MTACVIGRKARVRVAGARSWRLVCKARSNTPDRGLESRTRSQARARVFGVDDRPRFVCTCVGSREPSVLCPQPECALSASVQLSLAVGSGTQDQCGCKGVLVAVEEPTAHCAVKVV